MYPVFQYTLYGALQFVAAVAAMIAGSLTWKRRERAPGVFWLALTLWASAWWSACGGLEQIGISLQSKIVFSQLSYLGILLSPLFLWRFTYDYTNSGEKPSKTLISALSLFAVISLLITFTNDFHRLLWSDVRMVEALGRLNARYERGQWFWLNVAYCYGLILASSIMLLGHALGSQKSTRVQNWIIVISTFCPWTFSIAYLFRIPFIGEVDFTPLGFALTGILLSWNMLSLGLFSTMPFLGNTLLERMSDPVIVTDEASHLTLANPAAQDRFSLSIPKYSSTPVEDALANRPLLLEALRQAQTEPRVRFSENDCWWELQSSDLNDHHGRFRGRLHVLRETSQLHRALAMADENARKAQEANNAKSVFIAHVSHDLRTPLHAILGMLDLFEEQRTDKPPCPELDTIREAAQSLLTLVNGLLDVSRIEAGRIDLASKPFLLSDILQPVSELLGVIAQRKGISLSCHIAPSAAGGMRGDPDRLRLILLNVAGNAVKFTQAGSVFIEADAASAAPDCVRITISDTGPGISADRLPLLFNAFERGDPQVASQHEGTGLGLAIAKRLMDAMKGELSVSSIVGKGTRFTLLLPLADSSALAEIDAARALSSAPSRDAAVASDIAPKQDFRVLLADDDPLSRRVNEAILQHCRCGVDSVADGNAVLSHMENSQYDAIILDGMMPGLDGWETCRHIRNLPAGKAAAIPVIAISGDLMPESLARWKESGANIVLPKPIPQQELRRALERIRNHSLP